VFGTGWDGYGGEKDVVGESSGKVKAGVGLEISVKHSVHSTCY
jgi:hypothetical protein